MVELNGERVKCVDWVRQSISYILDISGVGFDGRWNTLKFERAKHDIPDNESSSIVFVDTIRISPMMNAVSRWCVDHILQRTEVSNHFCVDPSIIATLVPSKPISSILYTYQY
jgi:hypothetical protein